MEGIQGLSDKTTNKFSYSLSLPLSLSLVLEPPRSLSIKNRTPYQWRSNSVSMGCKGKKIELYFFGIRHSGIVFTVAEWEILVSLRFD